MIPTSQPNKAQKEWMEMVRSMGSVISGQPAVIHHAVGRKGRHNKIDIGHWFVIPLTDEEHKSLHAGEAPWQQRHMFKECETRIEFEKLAYSACVLHFADYVPLSYLPPEDVDEAIMDYHK